MTSYPSSPPLSFWLLSCCVLLMAMTTVGAVTRLTESGLSIVHWHAFSDMLPPLSLDAWQQKFAAYQSSPEYKVKNAGMALADFRRIYFWEWLHRLLGRVIGLVYALPLAYFWVAKKIPSVLKPRLIAFLSLGALQGAIGWYMVKSGLIDEPRVSHFRLALHLGTAFLLLALLWVQALLLWPRFRDSLLRYRSSTCLSAGVPGAIEWQSLRRHTWIGLGLLIVTMIWGAFTAGLDAGLACSDFPKTCHQWLPQEIFFRGMPWRNILHDPVAVQFTHRVFATLTFLTLFALGLRFIRTRIKPVKTIGLVLHIMILAQWLLGIGTVHSHVALPVAALHQLGAAVTLLLVATLTIFCGYSTDKPS